MNNYLLIGNPNVGKTTIFNRLTNSYEVVGNYSGVTVEKKQGKLRDRQGLLIDLPGIYSINPSTLDEGVTTNVLIDETFNGIINICDVSSLQRHLHLSIQLLEYGSPMSILLNFHDEFSKSERSVDISVLEKKLGVKVSPTVGTNVNENSEIINDVDNTLKIKFELSYGFVEEYISKITSLLPHNKLKRRFIAIALLEGNNIVFDYIKQFTTYEEIILVIDQCNELVSQNNQYKSTGVYIFEKRREFIKQLLEEANYTKISQENIIKANTYKVDKYLTHPYFGTIIFIGILILLYFVTFNLVGTPISDFLDYLLSNKIYAFLDYFLNVIGITGMFNSLVLDGIFLGVSSVIIFLPQVVILFIFLTLLESVGYLSRVGILFDKTLSRFGLNGKSIIPLITGIGCNVPAILGTRIIESKKERLLTILILPFVSCSARLPIYIIFVNTFFSQYAFIALLIIQLLGVITIIIVSYILNNTLFKHESQYLMLEIPPYRKPQLSYIFKVTTNKAKKFLVTVIKFVSIGTIIVWILTSFNLNGYNPPSNESFLAYISNLISPIFTPLGFGTWEATSSIISGFMAKELVVASLAVVYDATSSDLSTVLLQNFTTPAAISFIVFNALYVPCIATMGAIKQETGGWKWTAISITLSLFVAYFVAFVCYVIAGLIF